MKTTVSKLILVLFIAVSGIFVSCSSEGDGPSDAVKLPVKLVFPAKNRMHEFEYDAKKRISKFTYTRNGVTVCDFVYKPTNDKLDRIIVTNERKDTMFFTYKENNEILLSYKHEQGYNYTEVYKLNNNGQLTSYGRTSEEQTHFYTYDTKGNLMKEWYMSGPVGSQTEAGIEYLEYDKLKGIFSEVKTPAWVYFVLGELEYETSRLVNNSLNHKDLYEGNIFEPTYQYDIDGYPKKMYVNEELIVSMEYKSVGF